MNPLIAIIFGLAGLRYAKSDANFKASSTAFKAELLERLDKHMKVKPSDNAFKSRLIERLDKNVELKPKITEQLDKLLQKLNNYFHQILFHVLQLHPIIPNIDQRFSQ